MRRGILVVGGPSQSLFQDVRTVIRLLLECLIAFPRVVFPQAKRDQAARTRRPDALRSPCPAENSRKVKKLSLTTSGYISNY
jgi:hypothetical protein